LFTYAANGHLKVESIDCNLQLPRPLRKSRET